MTFADLDWISVILRALVYVGSIAVAGAVLFYGSVRGADAVERTVRRQITVGVILLLFVEAMRYAQFQMSVAGSDAALAFGPDMRWLAFDTPLGESALVRIAGAVAIVAFGLRVLAISIAAALVMIGSFALEGHTVSADGSRLLLATLITLHLAIVHWWLGALLPLRAATRAPNVDVAQVVHRFGQLALVLVAVLVVAGALLLGMLSNWTFDLSRPYQLGFAIKLTLFALVLGVAARNKLKWTPMLASAPEDGRVGLRRSLDIEIGLCLLVLIATSIATSFPPVG